MIKTKRALYEEMVTKVKALSPLYQIKAIATEVFSKSNLRSLEHQKVKEVLKQNDPQTEEDQL
jgi:hypothetical protein